MYKIVQDLNRENTDTTGRVLYLGPLPVASVELDVLMYKCNLLQTLIVLSYEADKTEQFLNVIYGLTEMLFSHLIHF